MVQLTVTGLFLGKVEHPWPDKGPSAIDKRQAAGPQEVGKLGFLNDAQADLKVHGGIDKAIHHYPADHYGSWKAEGAIARGAAPAAFGENISASGAVETDLCIGDVLRIGTALVQVSQGRQPCWKLNAHTGNSTMAFRFQETGRTGWYYRVLEAGWVEKGDKISLIDRLYDEWTVHRVTNARLTRRIEPAQALILSQMPELAENWREAFARFAKNKTDEDTAPRLKG
ncbi:MAG: MOSC domain-containing protein [Pseudomonadota bacterium]